MQAFTVETLSLSYTNCLFAAGLVLLLARVVYLLYFHPLASIPGPWLACVSDFWKAKGIWNVSFLDDLHALHAKYGDCVRIGPNEVSIVDPENVKTMYGHGTKFLKGPFYQVWGAGKGVFNHFSHRDPHAHATERRSVANAFSLNTLVDMEEYARKNSQLCKEYFDKAAEASTVVDLSELTGFYAYDTVSELTFGEPIGLLEAGRDKAGITHKMEAATENITLWACFNHFNELMYSAPVRFIQALRARGQPSGIDLFLGLAIPAMTKRMKLREEDPAAFEDNKDLMYRFMHSKESDGKVFGPNRLVPELLAPLVAGADTTRLSINAFIRFVWSSPETLKRLRSEMEKQMGEGKLDMPPTYAQAAKLDYLQACMKEAMRLHPGVGMPMQRVVPEGGCVLAGRYFEQGTLVGQDPLAVHLDKRAYGKDAASWRPDRWIEDRVEVEKYNLTFGQGSRVCIGKNISLMEMSIFLPVLVWHYDISFQNPDKPYVTRQGWFTPQGSFYATVKKV